MKVEVFDLLTVTVMVEQCDPDLTRVQFYLVSFARDWVYEKADVRPAPKLREWCLQCVLNEAALMTPFTERRLALLDRVRSGAIQIAGIDLAPDGWLCPRHAHHLNHVVNINWSDDL